MDGKKVDQYNVRFIVEDIRRTAEYASDIAEVVLNMNVEKVASG